MYTKIINLFECKNSIPENYLKLYFKWLMNIGNMLFELSVICFDSGGISRPENEYSF